MGLILRASVIVKWVVSLRVLWFISRLDVCSLYWCATARGVWVVLLCMGLILPAGLVLGVIVMVAIAGVSCLVACWTWLCWACARARRLLLLGIRRCGNVDWLCV